ncbi:hypothetical protein BaRGS_00004533 [Batillaria attramentaria]|uniref:Uncharacterized protein n=1 Tax=Batillaria attramentaria TaxID=370345 RepID=A0ABD0LX71_9CAEN
MISTMKPFLGHFSRLKEDQYEDLPDIPLPGRQTPIGMVRPSSPGGPGAGGHVSRPRSRARPTLGGRSYTDMGIQAEPSQSYPGPVDDNPYVSMDPVNKHYYYRLWRKDPPRPIKPIYREGRLGSPWRHIKACINNAGSHLVFIDGTVKSEENFFYPPESMFEPPNFSLYISPRLAPTKRQSTSVPATRRSGSKDTIFNERARQGFKYWPHEQKPIDSAWLREYKKQHSIRDHVLPQEILNITNIV